MTDSTPGPRPRPAGLAALIRSAKSETVATLLLAHVLGPVSLELRRTGIQFDRAATRIALALDVPRAEAAQLLREKWATSWATDIDQAANAVIRTGKKP